MLLLSVGLTCGVICSNDGTLISGTQDERSGQLGRIDRVDQPLDGENRCVFGAVRTGDDREHRTRAARRE